MSRVTDTPRWTPGQTVVERFLRPDGSEGQLHPLRVIADDGRELLGWIPDGTAVIGTRLADGRTMREAPLEERFRLPRTRFPQTWHGTSTLRLITENEWSSIWWFFEPDGRFRNWYVNLEIPLGRTEFGVDRCDGVLDLAVDPDTGWQWKDADEADAAVRAGRLTSNQLDRLYAEGERMIVLAEAGKFPFDGTWTDFRPDADWVQPELPAAVR